MESEFVLYAVTGWDSALTEAMLVWCGAAFRVVDVGGFDQEGPARDKLLSVNPLAQVPTLALPHGSILTESAAIALYLAEQCPGAELAPGLGHPHRCLYLHRLVWLVANVYPTFTYGDF